jgi:PD-(D/E)XK nuclease superfamily
MTESPFLPDGRQWAWNSSTLGPAKDCARKYYYEVILGYVMKEENVHLVFGGAFAKAVERYHRLLTEGATHDDALHSVVHQAMLETHGQLEPDALADMRGSAKVKTREILIRSIIWYLEEYKDDPCETIVLADGKPAVELTFKFPITDEIWLTGHLDRLVNYAGNTYVQDQKTTGASIGSWYFKRYNPDNQMSLYTIAGEVMWKTPVHGVIIDAVQVAVGFTKFERGMTQRTPEQNQEWLKDAVYWIERTWEAEKQGWPMNDSACQKYGGCPFIEVCSKSPQVRGDYLEGGYVKRVVNPLEVR